MAELHEMTEKDFGIIVKMVMGAYPGKVFTTEEQIQVYFDFLKKYSPRDVWIACRKWIKTESKPPAISDLLGLLSRTLTVKEQIQLDAE